MYVPPRMYHYVSKYHRLCTTVYVHTTVYIHSTAYVCTTIHVLQWITWKNQRYKVQELNSA